MLSKSVACWKSCHVAFFLTENRILFGITFRHARDISNCKGQLARAHYKMSMISHQLYSLAEHNYHKERAKILRAELKPELANAPYTEEGFSKLRPWMLW